MPTDTILYHQVALATTESFAEISSQAEDTMIYYATLRVSMSDRDGLLGSLSHAVDPTNDMDGRRWGDLQGPIQQHRKAYRRFQLWSEGHLEVCFISLSTPCPELM